MGISFSLGCAKIIFLIYAENNSSPVAAPTIVTTAVGLSPVNISEVMEFTLEN
jgi:hypothetical protein